MKALGGDEGKNEPNRYVSLLLPMVRQSLPDPVLELLLCTLPRLMDFQPRSGFLEAQSVPPKPLQNHNST